MEVFPEDWEVVKLGEVAPLQRGFDLPTKDIEDGPYPVVYSNGICNYHSKAMCEGPGLVTGRSGTIGRFTFIPTGGYWPHNTALWVTTFHGNDPLFVKYLYGTVGFENYATGSGVPTLNRNEVHQYVLHMPPLPEQRRIAAALGDMDKLIDNLSKRIEKKKAIKQGAMQELLTGKKRLPGFEGEWEKVELKDVLDYEQPQKYIVHSDEYMDYGIPVLTAGKSFILGHTTEDDGVYSTVPVILFDDFLAISRFVRFPFKVKSSAVKMLNVKDYNNSLYFIYLNMQHLDFRPSDHQRHWIGIYSKFEILLPKPDEQRAIAKVLGDMDAEIAKLEAKREKLIGIKKGMMSDLLTGKVRLKTEMERRK